MEHWTPDLQKEYVSRTLHGIPTVNKAPKKASASHAYDVYRRVRAWEGWQWWSMNLLTCDIVFVLNMCLVYVGYIYSWCWIEHINLNFRNLMNDLFDLLDIILLKSQEIWSFWHPFISSEKPIPCIMT